MKKVVAQFNHFCIETNEIIKDGSVCYYDSCKKGYYSLKSIAVYIFLVAPDTGPGMLQANEYPCK